EPARELRDPRRILAEYLDGACVGLQEARDDREQRGLAGAVGSEQAEHRLGGNVERHAVERELRAEALGETRDADGCAHRRLTDRAARTCARRATRTRSCRARRRRALPRPCPRTARADRSARPTATSRPQSARAPRRALPPRR